MDTMQEFFQQWAGMRWTDFLDILIVAVLLYKLFPLFRNTGTLRVALTVIGIIVVAWLTDVLNLYALNFILDQFVQIGLIALVVLFQPELRRMLDHLGHMKVKNFSIKTKKTSALRTYYSMRNLIFCPSLLAVCL